MEYRYVGDLVNTHGIKGEVRIISDSKFKKSIFQVGRILYLGSEKEPLEIERYRPHKIYDMVIFKGIHDINDVIAYKGDRVYINKADVVIDGYFPEDLIGLEVYYQDQCLGTVEGILTSKAHDIFRVTGEYSCLIPYVDVFVKTIDLFNHRIEVEQVEGLINEN